MKPKIATQEYSDNSDALDYMDDGREKSRPSDTRQSAEQKRARLSQKRYSGRCCPNCIPVVVEPVREHGTGKTSGGDLSTRPRWERGLVMPAAVASEQVWA